MYIIIYMRIVYSTSITEGTKSKAQMVVLWLTYYQSAVKEEDAIMEKKYRSQGVQREA